jgi:hypothetical protein
LLHCSAPTPGQHSSGYPQWLLVFFVVLVIVIAFVVVGLDVAASITTTGIVIVVVVVIIIVTRAWNRLQPQWHERARERIALEAYHPSLRGRAGESGEHPHVEPTRRLRSGWVNLVAHRGNVTPLARRRTLSDDLANFVVVADLERNRSPTPVALPATARIRAAPPR